MPYIPNHKQKFADLTFNIENQDQLRKQANGGNSVLFTYPPSEEHLYLKEAKALPAEKFELIDTSKLFVDFVDADGWEDFAAYYKDMNPKHIVFKSANDPETDFFDLIISAIKQAGDNDKIPMLIRSGCLLGTGIENVNIMEHKDIMNLQHPLVIFYPSTISGDNILFLNFKPASKYRCTLVK